MSAITQEQSGRTTLQWPVVSAAALALVAGLMHIGPGTDGRMTTLFVIGALLGIALYHAAFGFTAGWRAFIIERRGAGLRAQMALIALATVVVLPALGDGTFLGRPVNGAVALVGVSVLVGAFLFGLGMQLGGGCGSGTLFTVGGGSARMLVTLFFFIVGSVVGTAHLPWWLATPAWGAISLGRQFGVAEAVVLQLAACGAVAGITLVLERRRHGTNMPSAPPATSIGHRLLHGPWPLSWGAAALAALSVATLAVAGHTWSITFAFGLWGAKALSAVGVAVESWDFWTWPYPSRALAGSVWDNTVSVMNFGIILGALLAAGLAGRFAPSLNIPLRSLVAAVIGGFLMGYGARLAFGCNIGAFFSGIASGSVHGWLWFASAFMGSILGVWLRPWFGLEARRPSEA